MTADDVQTTVKIRVSFEYTANLAYFNADTPEGVAQEIADDLNEGAVEVNDLITDQDFTVEVVE